MHRLRDDETQTIQFSYRDMDRVLFYPSSYRQRQRPPPSAGAYFVQMGIVQYRYLLLTCRILIV